MILTFKILELIILKINSKFNPFRFCMWSRSGDLRWMTLEGSSSISDAYQLSSL
jgi:hypothetical protein